MHYSKNRPISFSNIDLYESVVAQDKLKNLKKHNSDDTIRLNNDVKKELSETTSSIPIFSIICVIFIIFILFTIWRYSLVSQSIERGNTLATFALLSPEIGTAVQTMFI